MKRTPGMSSSFGKWYEEQQAEQGSEGASSSWFDMEQGIPLFSTEGMPSISFEGMRESMEASMPRKILGMGYQQRFQVIDVPRVTWKQNRSQATLLDFALPHVH